MFRIFRIGWRAPATMSDELQRLCELHNATPISISATSDELVVLCSWELEEE